jgi:hypothetical protein
MTPSEIAAKLTPAQVKQLSRWKGGERRLSYQAKVSLARIYDLTAMNLLSLGKITPLGLAVLAALDKGAGE